MRKILFRGKRLDNGEWVEGYYAAEPYMKNTYNCGYILENEKDLFAKKAWLVDSRTVGQFTGLTDKNGRKIFEGDICRIKEHGDVDLAVISFEHGAFYATPHNANIHEHTLWDIWYNDYDIEVNGNIHDNPELLEVVEE